MRRLYAQSAFKRLDTTLVVELGAGSALPSLLSSTLSNPPSLVVVTDHPDETIFTNLSRNARNNAPAVSPRTRLHYLPYIWGDSPRDLLSVPLCVWPRLELLSCVRFSSALVSPSPGYDAMILSDLLYFDTSHTDLLQSILSLLARRPSSRAYVAAGKYTSPTTCNAFLLLVENAGLLFEEGEVDDGWRGSLEVVGLSQEELSLRKANVRWWTLRWSASEIP